MMQPSTRSLLTGSRFTAAFLAIVLTLSLAAQACTSFRLDCPACQTVGPTGPCGSNTENIANKLFSGFTGTPSILTMSAGGSWGAWGAGVLHGWGTLGTRPQFQLVTGASTGALLATFALLGNMDVQMKEVYTQVENKDIYKRRPIFTIAFKNSINTLQPLRELVKSTFTPTVVTQVGMEYLTKGRQIWIATTDLDKGQLCDWNLSEIAANGDYNKYIDLLIASCANPGIFNVQEIDGELHADGGVRNQLFTNIMAAVREAYPGAATPTPQAYAIVNGQVVPRRQCTPNMIGFVLMRSMAVLQNSALRTDLAAVDSVLKSTTSPKPKWDLNISRIPSDYPLWPAPDQFKPSQMQDLFKRGETAGAANVWEHDVPAMLAEGPSTAPCIPPY